MRIPGGDLAPARRRHYGGSYGRRRHRRQVRLGAGVLLLVVAAGAVYVLRKDDAKAPHRLGASTQSRCPTVAPSTAPAVVTAVPKPQQVRLVLLNGTSRNGLAATVGNELAADGFVVVSQGNSPQALNGDSVVQYGAGALPAGTLVSRWVQGSTLLAGAKVPAGEVQLVLGSGFSRLSTPAELLAAAQQSPQPTPPSSASAAPACLN